MSKEEHIPIISCLKWCPDLNNNQLDHRNEIHLTACNQLLPLEFGRSIPGFSSYTYTDDESIGRWFMRIGEQLDTQIKKFEQDKPAKPHWVGVKAFNFL